MRVYKFLSAKWAKEAVFRRRLKISLLNALNDPWDGHGLIFSSGEQKRAWKKTHNQMAQVFGMTCFSLTWDDPVMWSHYGDQHHGVALGFDVSDEYAMKVTYRDELNRLDEVLLATSKDKQIDVLQRVFATKFTNWKYELEVRLFTEIRNSDEASGHFFKAFDSGLLLKEVIFGARYQNPEEMAALLPKIRNDREITCWKAALGNETFKLIVDPDWQQYR